jgi:hypothetical protein
MAFRYSSSVKGIWDIFFLFFYKAETKNDNNFVSNSRYSNWKTSKIHYVLSHWHLLFGQENVTFQWINKKEKLALINS